MLYLEINSNDLFSIGEELGATEEQVKFAISRATRRTAAKLRKLSFKLIKDELGLKKVNSLRARLKTMKISGTGKRDKIWSGNGWNKIDGYKIFYGLNDLPVHHFKGSIKENRPNGASFSGKAGNFSFKDAFVGKIQLRAKDDKDTAEVTTILKRVGKSRVPLREIELPIKDKTDVLIEDQVFDKIDDIFWHFFEQDLTARVKFGIGLKDYKWRI